MRSLAYIVLLSICAISASRRAKWQKNHLTWNFSDPFNVVPSSVQRDLVRKTIETAFLMWQAAMNDLIKIEESSDENADIQIYFAKRKHENHEAFDGTGGMAAHSGLPPRGYLHLDADEQWSFDGEKGLDLRYVILHETGHLLGLRHSKIRRAIMYPSYRKFDDGMQLHLSDIKAIRKLYKDNFL